MKRTKKQIKALKAELNIELYSIPLTGVYLPSKAFEGNSLTFNPVPLDRVLKGVWSMAAVTKKRNFIVSSNCFEDYSKEDNWDSFYCTEIEMINLAKYYNMHSDNPTEIDLNDLNNAIEYVSRIDVIKEIE